MTRTNVYDERRSLYKKKKKIKKEKEKKERKNKRGKERRVERSDEKFAGSRVQWRPWAVRGEICQREILCCSCTSTTHECTARWNRPNEERKALGGGKWRGGKVVTENARTHNFRGPARFCSLAYSRLHSKPPSSVLAIRTLDFTGIIQL